MEKIRESDFIISLLFLFISLFNSLTLIIWKFLQLLILLMFIIPFNIE